MKQCKQAFTLIELLVVICIIAILASMLLPALQSARDSASSASCISNLGQISKAFQMYVTSYDDFMPMLTAPQNGTGKCGWVKALAEVTGQPYELPPGRSESEVYIIPKEKNPFIKSLFCESSGSGSVGSYKSYSLNNLMEVIHPRIDYTIGDEGQTLSTGKLRGYISGNRTTSVFAASDLIVIGENVSTNNTLDEADFQEAGSDNNNNIDSPGSASPIHQFIALKLRMSSHMTAGNLFLDGHVKHTNPEKTVPTKAAQNIIMHTSTNPNAIGDGTAGTLYNNKKPDGISTCGFGNWTDCLEGKKDEVVAIKAPTVKGKKATGSPCKDGDCHARK